MDKSMFAITGNFGKAWLKTVTNDELGLYSYDVYGAQLGPIPNIPRIWRIWRISQYTPTYQGSYIRPIYTKYTKCIWRIVYIRLRGVAMPTGSTHDSAPLAGNAYVQLC